MPSSKLLNHLDARGQAHMVDVGHKPASRRIAIAEARVRLSAKAREALAQGSKKGDVLAVARVAGIQAAKRTSALIPLCHLVPLSHVAIELEPTASGLHIESRAESVAPTGVEMEALTAASVAALTVYDMLKAVDRGITIETIRLLEKRGGKSGTYKRRNTGRR